MYFKERYIAWALQSEFPHLHEFFKNVVTDMNSSSLENIWIDSGSSGIKQMSK
jgi:hypothetical protein